MPADTVLRLLLWAVALNAGILILLLWRRGLQGRVGFAALLAADLILSVVLLAANREDHPLAFVAIGTFLFLVIVPMVIRVGTAWAVRRGHWDLAMRLTDLRELLQPGAGVAREKELLAFLRQVQTGDTADILDQLRQQAALSQDPEFQAILQEQILTLLVLERRWTEAEAQAREAVTPVMVAARPRLGAALIRVYGEVGDLAAVVRTMSLVEGGGGAQDPETAEVLEHCRIMVLAFTGHAEELEALFGQRRAPPAEAKVHAFWLGVAWQQAGHAERARQWLDRSESMLGAEDERAREAIEARRALLDEPPLAVVPADPEQTQRLVGAIRERASQQLAQPRMRPSLLGQTPVTLMLVVVNLVLFAAVELFGGGANPNRRLILAGASLVGAVHDGEYWRLVTAMFLHAGWFHVALNVFMLWFLGRFAEQLLGSVRLFIVYVSAGVVGNLASHLWRQYPVSVGASSSIFGILGAALAVLLLSRGRVPESWRRSVVFLLLLVIGLSFLPGLVDVKQIDNYAHFGGLVGGLVIGAALIVTAGRRVWGWFGPALGLACVLALLYSIYGLFTSNLEELRWIRSEERGVVVRHPVTWFAEPGKHAGVVMLSHLLDADHIIVKRGEPSGATAAEWQSAQLALWKERARKNEDGVKRLQVRPLPRPSLPAAWRGIRLDVTDNDGSRRVVVWTYARRGPRGHVVGWLGRLDTAPQRLKRLLPVFGQILSQARAAP